MKWYTSSAADGVVLSTRVRLARNLAKYPFSVKLGEKQRALMLQDVRCAFEKYGTDRYNFVDMTNKTCAERNAMVEEHIISPEFAGKPESEKRILIYDENGSVSVMAGEEDHLRIQAVRPGFAVEEAYAAADRVDDMLGKGLEFAFDEKYGYLTGCLSNTGSGMRISCMLHLPMLTRNNYMKSVMEFCSRLGLTVRGFYGEGSNADGEIYQISNQITLGISDEETIAKLKEAVNAIVEKEKSLRETLKKSGISVQDKLWRSYGILTNARTIGSTEFLSLWSDCMLGKNCGIIDVVRDKNMVQLLIESMPAHIIQTDENANDARVRDELRANRIREYLKA